MLLEATQFWVLCHGSPRKRVPPNHVRWVTVTLSWPRCPGKLADTPANPHQQHQVLHALQENAGIIF